ncbi:hypothetical protein HY637_03345 [Candidatus Woesearchaeota archaeon]|nr:hypothetical protein [Candidatus Woesearchaeota archaeon]
MAAEQATKAKKKQWYQIVAPKQFGEAVIGETLVSDPGLMIGKTLNHNLMNLTNDIKRQNINIYFKVISVDGNRGMTSIIGYEIIPSSVKRFVRRNSEKMDLSFVCETADNVSLRVKPLVITKADVKGSVAAKMRNNIVQYLTKTIKKTSYGDLMSDLISHKIQSEMRSALNRIYPIKVCEIRYFGIEAREHGLAPPVGMENPQEAKGEAQTEVKEEKA